MTNDLASLNEVNCNRLNQHRSHSIAKIGLVAVWTDRIRMDPKLFQAFSKIAYDASGICLTEGKEVMLQARINTRLRALGVDTAEAYLDILNKEPGGVETRHFISAVTTNVTSFFRENAHFELVARFIASALQAGQTRFRFWSAACSTGEEPYSLAIAVHQALAGRNGDCQILATDIDPNVLATASAALYPERLLSPVPNAVRSAYFSKEGEQYRVQDHIKRMVHFGRLNLIRPPYPMKGPFDMIFCRNVMIYFDIETRERLVNNLAQLLRPDGYLMIGHSETLTGLTAPFHSVAPATYMKKAS